MDNGFNHVGVGVGDVDAAIAFYRGVFECRVLRDRFEVTADGPDGEEARDVLNSRPFKRIVTAHLATPDGVGIELFQLVDPLHERRSPELEYWKSGTFHFCMTAVNIDETLKRVLALGGRQTSRSWPRDPADPSNRMVYCTDPWGTVIELYTHSFTSMYGGGGLAARSGARRPRQLANTQAGMMGGSPFGARDRPPHSMRPQRSNRSLGAPTAVPICWQADQGVPEFSCCHVPGSRGKIV